MTWSELTAHINHFFTSLGPAGPFLKALLVFLAGVFLAKIVSGGIRGILHRFRVDEHLTTALRIDARGTEKAAAKFLFYILMILVVMMTLEAGGLTQVTQPLRDLFTQFASYFPRLLGGALLLVVALILAQAARLVVVRLLEPANLDQRAGIVEGRPIQTALGAIAYFIVILSLLPAVLEALRIERVAEPMNRLVGQIWTYTGHLLAAMLVMGVGYLVARIVQRVLVVALEAIRVNTWPARLGFPGGSDLWGIPLSVFLSYLAMVTILVVVLAEALNVLNLEFIGEGFTREIVPGYLRILGGIAIFLLGWFAANWTRQALMARSVRWARVCRIVILVFAVAMGLQFARLTPISTETFERLLTGIIIAFTIAAGVGGALALGLGGKSAVQRYLDTRVK